MRNKLNIKTLSDKAYEKLRTSKRGKNYIYNILNFDMLSNTDYADKFYYSPISERTEAAPSDYVDSIIYLGEERIKNHHTEFAENIAESDYSECG